MGKVLSEPGAGTFVVVDLSERLSMVYLASAS
jgi:hypothetical protein